MSSNEYVEYMAHAQEAMVERYCSYLSTLADSELATLYESEELMLGDDKWLKCSEIVVRC